MDLITPMIETIDLTKEYPEGKASIRALNKVNLSIVRGEFVTITGPSGSGKTTLLNLVGLLDYPSDGSIRFDGMDVSGLQNNKIADFRRQNIGFIFQLHQLIPTITAVENIMLPVMPYQREIRFNPLERAQDLLREVGLGDCAHKLPSALSGGEQQRVAIARALINSPRLILADEPTGNLDKYTGEEVMQLLREINQRLSATVILVTHNPLFENIGDRHFGLIKGEIDEQGVTCKRKSLTF